MESRLKRRIGAGALGGLLAFWLMDTIYIAFATGNMIWDSNEPGFELYVFLYSIVGLSIGSIIVLPFAKKVNSILLLIFSFVSCLTISWYTVKEVSYFVEKIVWKLF